MTDSPVLVENERQRSIAAHLLGRIREPWSIRLLGEMLFDQRPLTSEIYTHDEMMAIAFARIDIGGGGPDKNEMLAFVSLRDTEIFGWVPNHYTMQELYPANEHQIEGLIDGTATLIVPGEDPLPPTEPDTPPQPPRTEPAPPPEKETTPLALPTTEAASTEIDKPGTPPWVWLALLVGLPLAALLVLIIRRQKTRH